MNTAKNSRYRRAATSGRSERQGLLQRSPSSKLRAIVFLVATVAASCPVLLLPKFDIRNDGVIVAITIVASLLAFITFVSRVGTQARRRKRSFYKDIPVGILTGLVLVAATGLIHRYRDDDSGLKAPIPRAERTSSIPIIEPEPHESKAKPKVDLDSRAVLKPVVSSGKASLSEGRILPAGTRMSTKRKSQTEIMLALQTPSGEYVRGLANGDFKVASLQDQIIPFEVNGVQASEQRKAINISFLLDESLDSAARKECEAALTELMSAAPNGNFRLSSFGTLVRILTSWTSDNHVVTQALKKTRNARGTAFPTAVEIAGDDLAQRSGEKILVIFNASNGALTAKQSEVLGRSLRKNSVHLLLISSKASWQRSGPLERLVYFGRGQTMATYESDELAKFVEDRSSKRVPPHYAIRLQQPVDDLTITVGTGDSRLSKTISKIR